jgi:hypothetical protein
MEKRNLKEITRTDSLALTAIIDYWKDYDSNAVLLAYAELKRRNFALNDKLLKRLNEFCAKNNGETIESLLTSSLKAIGYNTYEECYEKEIGEAKKVEKQQATKIEIGSSFSDNTEKKYPALRTISDIYKVFGWLIAIATIIVAAIFGQGRGGVAFALITIIFGALIVLGVFAVAESIMVFIDIEENTRTNNKQK